MPQHPEFQGGCACGEIRYTCTGAPGFSFHCQCRDCQHASGTGHSSAFLCKKADTQISGELSWYEREAPSGNVIKQGFCGTCGSPVLNQNSGYPDTLFLTAGSLDDPALFNPTNVVHRDAHLTWDLRDPEAKG